MILLILAALLWVGVHVGIAGTAVRRRLAGRLGDNGFRGAFSLMSLLAISLLVIAWKSAPFLPLWRLPAAGTWVIVAVMLAAFVLFAGSVLTPNATSVGQEKALDREASGIFRVTRHPMLWSFALWGLCHIASNGNVGATLFFGAFALTALLGMPSIDAKIAAREPARFAAYARATSIVPFAAIAAGRNHFAPAELLRPALIGAVAWGALLYAHPYIFGVPALPVGQ